MALQREILSVGHFVSEHREKYEKYLKYFVLGKGKSGGDFCCQLGQCDEVSWCY